MEENNLAKIIDRKLISILENKELPDKDIFSAEDRINLSRNIVSDKVEKILKKEIMIWVIANKENIKAKLEHWEYKNEEKIKDFLKILWANNIEIKDLSFEWGDYSWDTYWVNEPTLIEFNY